MTPPGRVPGPSCGSAAAALHRLCATPPVAPRRPLGQAARALRPFSAEGGAHELIGRAPALAASSPLALLVLPVAPASARAVVNSLPPHRGPLDVLSSGILLAVLLVAFGRALLRRARSRRDGQAPPELLRVPVSELAMFDRLRARGDELRLEEAWRELVARKRAEREQRIAASEAKRGQPIESLADLPPALRDLEPSDASARRPVAPSLGPRGLTPVKAAAAQASGPSAYLPPQPPRAAQPSGSGAAPAAPPAAAESRFPPPRAVYKRPAPADAAAAAAPSAGAASPAGSMAVAAGRYAASRAALPRPSERAPAGSGSRALDLRAASARAESRRSYEAAAPAPPPAPEPASARSSLRRWLGGQPPQAQTVLGAAAAASRAPWEQAGAAPAADGRGESAARSVCAALCRSAVVLLKLPGAVLLAFAQALAEPPAQGPQPQAEGAPEPAPPPADAAAAEAPAPPSPQAAEAEAGEAPPAKPPSAAWALLAAKHEQIDSLLQRGAAKPPPRG